MTEDTGKNTRKKHLFKPGQSGNPSGRPPGSRNKTTLAVQSLLQGQAEKLTETAINAALAGDMTALKLCFDRIYPSLKELPINIKLPSIMNAQDLPVMTAALIKAVSSGDLLPTEAEKISKLIDVHRQAIEAADFDARLKALESAQGNAE